MKFFLSLLFCNSIVAGFAQTWSVPPPASLDGVLVKAAGANSGTDHWGGTASLGAYAIFGDADSNRLVPGALDSTMGLRWTHSIPLSLLAAKDGVALRGGFVRAIFVGETAGALNNFGYSYSGIPSSSDSFSVFTGIQSTGDAPVIAFGDHVDISFLPGELSAFDLWLDSVDETRGGIYSFFNTVGGSAPGDMDQFLWATQTISVPTWVPSLGAYANIDTYLVSLEDLRLEADADRDYSDFRVALQFLDFNGESMAPIPEPAHFAGLLTLGTLIGVLYMRRRALL
jgi:hypothetical protein